MNTKMSSTSLLVFAQITSAFGVSVSSNNTFSNASKYCNCSTLASFSIKTSIGEGIVCEPGDGVWAPPVAFYPSVDQFCYSIEGVDISSGYSVSDTFLITLTPQGENPLGDDGKIIFAVWNEEVLPAYHMGNWIEDCAMQMKAMITQDCFGDKGDTKGGKNAVGGMIFEATIKKGDTW